MKKKRDWATIAGVVAGTLAYLKFAPKVLTTEPEEKETEETPKEYCISEYGNLTDSQYAIKLLDLDVLYEQGDMDDAIYQARRNRLRYCRIHSAA